MPCDNPITGYKALRVNPSGKRSIVFNAADGFRDKPVELPCGRCMGCRLERSRQWAIRCVHEAELYEDNSFITLTYDDSHLPKHGSLDKSHFQKFMKRLRFANSDTSIRYFHCGEYGEELSRPHYHAILFGFDFPDKKYWKTQNGNRLYISESLGTVMGNNGTPISTGEGHWYQGISTIGNVTFESAAYVARYVTKKITGPDAKSHYGERIPEYITMSRRPGIGKKWYEKFKKDVFPDDFVVVRGKKMKPPKFYMTALEKEAIEQYETLKAERQNYAIKKKPENTHMRRKAKKHIRDERIKLLSRKFENE